MNAEPGTPDTHGALVALSGVVGALALAEALGAPRGALVAALERLVGATARVRGLEADLPSLRRRPPAHGPRKRVRAPRASKAEREARRAAREEREAQERAEAAWDPETPFERIEVGRCRALLLEIVRRAIHDWILYRSHSNIVMRRRAETAYVWLFEEEPGHPWWKLREKEGRTITSFLAICDALDLDPGFVRERARQTTVKQIMTSGRPAEYRRPSRDVDYYEEHAVDEGSVKASSLDALDRPRSGFTSEVEAHFASYTPDYG